jgi:hypothetical protein
MNTSSICQRFPGNDMAGELLVEADVLLCAGFTRAAGMTSRVVLEIWLRQRCETLDCLPRRRRRGLRDYTQALLAAGVIDDSQRADILRCAKTGNAVAHGHDVGAADVGELVAAVRVLAGRDLTETKIAELLGRGTKR